MNWKQFIASLVGDLAWPMALLCMFFLVRDQIGKLIEKIAHLKYKDLEVDFEKVKKQAEALQDMEPPIEAEEAEESPMSLSLEEQILETVESAPSAAILLAWSSLEMAIASAVARLAISPESPSYRSPLHNIEMLEKHSGLSGQHVALLHEMRMLRNKIAHEQRAMLTITGEQAFSYANAATMIMTVLNSMARTIG